MLIKIEGRPIAKKNSKRIGTNKYTGRVFITSSKQWGEFEKYALEQLLQYKNKTFKGIVRVDYDFYYKGQYRLDVDNAMAGINDVLQEAGIIEDDRFIEAGSFKITRGNNTWVSFITINELEGGEK